jgi:hypothetical protein
MFQATLHPADLSIAPDDVLNIESSEGVTSEALSDSGLIAPAAPHLSPLHRPTTPEDHNHPIL